MDLKMLKEKLIDQAEVDRRLKAYEEEGKQVEQDNLNRNAACGLKVESVIR